MKNNVTKKAFAVLLAAALLACFMTAAFAEKGPYPEHSEDFYYARLELIVLNEQGKPVLVSKGDWEEQDALPLYGNGKATDQPGASYDPGTNTLTLTDFEGRYLLNANLMGDDFTVCVKGDCRLSRISVSGGGVMQPKWGGSLRITGDGALTVNEDKLHESGIIFYPQEEETAQFTVDPQVTLNVYGFRTAVEVYAYTGEFTMKRGDETVEIKKGPAVRERYVYLSGYSNPWEDHIRLCRNAADPEGLYDMSVWYKDEAMTVISEVTVDRYVYIEKYDLYLEDHQWAAKTGDGDKVSFASVQEANDAGFTLLYDDGESDAWKTVNGMGNYGSIYQVYQNAQGDRYVVDNGYDDNREYRKIAMTIEPLDEIPGEYLFLYTPDVDPETLTEAYEEVVIEGMYDYSLPQDAYTAEGAAAPAIDRIDVSIPEDVFPFGREITAEEMYDLFLDHMVTVNTSGVYLIVREVKETETGCYQTLPITANKLFSDKPFAGFDPANGYEIVLTFGNSYDQTAGAVTKFADEVTLYVNGAAAGSAAPLAADKDEMAVKGSVVLSAGTFRGLLLGDVDGDGTISSGDARLALRRSVGLEDYAEGSRAYLACDVDCDGGVSSADARLILRGSVGLENTSLWGKAIRKPAASDGGQRTGGIPMD